MSRNGCRLIAYGQTVRACGSHKRRRANGGYGVYSQFRRLELYFWRKWIPTGNLDGYWGEYNRTPYEFPLIRLGDVILMLAEAYNEAGATDKAIAEVNKIRARVGMPGLNSGAAWLAVGGKGRYG